MTRLRRVPLALALLGAALAAPAVAPAAAAQSSPTPAAEEDSGDAPAPASAPAPRPRVSWVADRRAFGAGDVLTVMVDEFTLASANLGNLNSDNRRRQNDVSVTMRMPSSGSATSVGLSSTNSADQQQRGEATRQNRFQSEMTVRVVEVLANGVLRVEGRKLVTVDRNQQEVSLSGFVRPQDVGPFNQVDSWRVGELRLDYRHQGRMGTPRGGLVGRLVGWLWP